MTKGPMNHIAMAALMGCQRVARMPKRHYLIIILSLGAFTSLIAATYESRNRRLMNTINEASAGSNLDYTGRGIQGNVPGARMMMANSVHEVHATMSEPAIASTLSMDSPMRGMKQDASYYSGPDNSLNIGAMVLDAMKQRSADDEEEKSNQTHTRMLIHEGNVELKVYIEDMEPMAEKIISLAKEKARGYVEARNMVQETRWEYNALTRTHENMEYWFIHLELRIVNAVFHPILGDITSLVKRHNGGIVSMSTQSRDATDEYVDVSARADTLEKSRQALEVLLTRSTTVQDVLQVQRELTSLTQQVESYRKRAIHIQKASDMSRLSVHIREQKRISSPETVTWDPYKTLFTAFHHMKLATQFMGDALIYAVIWALPLSLIVLVSLILSRPQATRRD